MNVHSSFKNYLEKTSPKKTIAIVLIRYLINILTFVLNKNQVLFIHYSLLVIYLHLKVLKKKEVQLIIFKLKHFYLFFFHYFLKLCLN